MLRTTSACFAAALTFVLSVSALAAPVPTVCTLGSPVSVIGGMDIDQCGRIVLVDATRQAVMRFDTNGRLDRIWCFDDTLQTFTYEADVQVRTRPDGRIYVTPAKSWVGPLRLLDIDALQCRDLAEPKDWRYRLVAARDGGFYAAGYADQCDRSKGYCMRIYSAEGKLKATWPCCETYDFAVGPDGCVYAIGFRGADANCIFVYRSDGKLLRRGPLPNRCTSVSCDIDGGIYAASRDGSTTQIVQIGADGKTQRVIKEYADRDAADPGVRLVARNGLLYVLVEYRKAASEGYSRTRDREIQVLTIGGQCVARYVPPATKYDMPGSLAVHEDGAYAVQSVGALNAQAFGPDDKPVGQAFSGNCCSIAPGPDGGYYAAGGSSLDRYDKTGKQAKQLSKYRPADVKPYLTDNVEYIARDRNDHLWGASWGYRVNEIFEFGPDDSLVRRLRLSDEWWPGEIAVDASSGYLYCNSWLVGNLTPATNSIAKYDMNGKRVGTVGKEGSGVGELYHNNGMAVDRSGRLFVADTGNSRVQVFDSDGISLGVWSGPADRPLNHPLDVEFGPNETLWVSDTFNDRIVRVPLSEFWRQVTKSPTPQKPAEVIAKTPLPDSGKASVEAIVIAGTDDFSGDVYVESRDRAWGLCVTLPEGEQLLRGELCRLTGALIAGSRAMDAGSVEHMGRKDVPGALGTANLYVGGYRSTDKLMELSNLCMLVRTWGRVVSVDEKSQVLVINDGSYEGSISGLAVYFGGVKKPIRNLPGIGQYIGVTGVSTTWVEASGRHIPAVRIRDDADIQVFAEQ